jgi:hypothetical protein
MASCSRKSIVVLPVDSLPSLLASRPAGRNSDGLLSEKHAHRPDASAGSRERAAAKKEGPPEGGPAGMMTAR